MTSVIEITNPKICAFFNLHTHLNIETLILQQIDIIEKNPLLTSSNIPHCSVHNSFQINELKTSLANLKEAIAAINKSVLFLFFQHKTQYVNEFKTIYMSNNVCGLLENNGRFVAKINQLIYSHIPEYYLKNKYPQLHDKIAVIVRQFHKIINTNIETIFAKNDITSLHSEYISNFEINSSHMIQSIQQNLNEYFAGKSDVANKLMNDLAANVDSAAINYSRLNYELNDFVHNIKKYNSYNENQFETMISQIFPTSAVSNVVSTEEMNSVLLTRENGKSPLSICGYLHKDRNINAEEIKEFNKSLQTTNSHGILISQYTGITSKPHFYIDINVRNITIYLHNQQFSDEKLKIAADIIDNIHSKLSELIVSPENKQTISKDVLDDINREYQTFITQRESLIGFIKDTHKKMLAQVGDIVFPSLDKYLASRYSCYKKQGFNCDICGTFSVSTLKGLAAHKRGCTRKNGATTSAVALCEPTKEIRKISGEMGAASPHTQLYT